MDALTSLFGSPGFMPHGHCYLWEPDVLWLNVGSDALIALAYYSIPLGLLFFVRKRRDLAFRWMFGLFSTFIFACGTTHLFEIVTVWHPAYRIEGALKLITGVVSAATAALIWPLIPRALALPSPAQLSQEVQTRRSAESQLRELNRDLERRVAERTEELRRTNEELEQFAYAASHDLREPLRTVRGFVELLEEDYRNRLDEAGNGYIEHIVNGTQRMGVMIEQLLQYSRAGRNVTLVAVDADKELDAAVATLGGQLKDVHLQRHPLPSVRFAQGQLERIFLNLLSNAVKYRSDDRPLRLEVGAEADADGAHHFYVKDNGIGIGPEHIEAVFEPFRRLHAMDERGGGTGIGLALCRKVVELRGGRMWVTSNLGRGSTFHFTIPPSETAHEANDSSENPSRGASRRQWETQH